LGVCVGHRVFFVPLGGQPFEGYVAIKHEIRVGYGAHASEAKQHPDDPPSDVSGRGQVGTDCLNGVICDACLASDDLAKVHLHLQVLVGENHYNEHCEINCVNVAIHVQIFDELFVPHDLLTC